MNSLIFVALASLVVAFPQNPVLSSASSTPVLVDHSQGISNSVVITQTTISAPPIGYGSDSALVANSPYVSPTANDNSAPMDSEADNTMGAGGQSDGGPGAYPPPSDTGGSKNEWGDDSFLSDEDAGVSDESVGGGGFFSDVWDSFGDE